MKQHIDFELMVIYQKKERAELKQLKWKK